MPTLQVDDLTGKRVLGHAFDHLGQVVPIAQVRARSRSLSTRDRRRILEQASMVVRDLYVHLPIKRARHAADPLLRLRMLGRMPELDDWAFHREVLAILAALRDIHTGYCLPSPYHNYVAFLPFLIKEYWKGKTQRFVVSRLLGGFSHPTFRAGVDIETWDGMQVRAAIENEADQLEGSNPEARFAVGLQYMTVRWLATMPPPDADWVLIGYRDDGVLRYVKLPWQVLKLKEAGFEISQQALWVMGAGRGDAAPVDLAAEDAAEKLAEHAVGLSLRGHMTHLARHYLYGPQHDRADDSGRRRSATGLRLVRARAGAADIAIKQQPLDSRLPAVLEARVLHRKGSAFGYIRIRHFRVEKSALIEAFTDLLDRLPRRGLVLDIRSNPGGQIESAEMLLQFLSPVEIEPLRFSFVGTELAERLTTALEPDVSADEHVTRMRTQLAETWGASTLLAMSTGEAYSSGHPMTPVEEANRYGQRYFGPVVLIVDALSYSSADMFAAGFQDHEIGDVLGVAERTGAGGANVWPHQTLVKYLPDAPQVQPLPGETSVHFAIRRCLRACGKHAGMPIEDLGVQADQIHRPTRRDVMHEDEDLLSRAVDILAKKPRREFAVKAARTATEVVITIVATGADRVDCYIDGRPERTVDLVEGRATRLRLPHRRSGPIDLLLLGFEDGRVVARCRRELIDVRQAAGGTRARARAAPPPRPGTPVESPRRPPRARRARSRPTGR